MNNIFKKVSGDFCERFDAAGDTDIEISADGDASGTIIIKNSGRLNLNISALHTRDNVKIHIAVKLLAAGGSENALTAVADVAPGITGVDSDITFSIIARPGAKIKMQPNQRISSAPQNAGHSASIYHPAPAQILYLEAAGLSAGESEHLMEQIFMEDLPDNNF